MGAAPLSWLAKIGGDTLKTKAKLLSSAINELYDDGFKKKDIVGLDYIKAATAADLKNKVPEANAVKELNSNLIGKNISYDFTLTNISNFIAYKVGNMVVFNFVCVDSTKDCKITTVKHKPISNTDYFAICYQAWANKDFQCVLSGACLTDGTIVDFKSSYNLPYPFISGRSIIYFT